ncbi:hypothetical protein [Stutzerimonas stutzeri]|uniref:Uncharacterized protein n=1 Tax=Stutzerimonas stutzeri TaxID=316 RepID=A0AA42P8G4_STUST|nr:hypothetical protein [Stutzerimonas stutzeri]MDH1236511.1 hypothetical protein [Stutzerimonas stutzeri]
MTTHSPAPWRYCPKTGQIVDANNRQVARVWNTSNRVRDHANGELIAAAPTAVDVPGSYFARLGESDLRLEAFKDALTLCVASLDQLLPYLAEVPADIKLLNYALMTARPLLQSHATAPHEYGVPK